VRPQLPVEPGADRAPPKTEVTTYAVRLRRASLVPPPVERRDGDAEILRDLVGPQEALHRATR
jgi:hypothetical protein